MDDRGVYLIVLSFSTYNKTLEVKNSQKQRCLRKVHLCQKSSLDRSQLSMHIPMINILNEIIVEKYTNRKTTCFIFIKTINIKILSNLFFFSLKNKLLKY